MSQQPVELILIRHLASRLKVPVFVIDADGSMVYFNELAEPVLGRRFDEMRVLSLAEWTGLFRPTASGRALDIEEVPLVVALRQARPVHHQVQFTAADGAPRSIEVTSFPLIGAQDEVIGAVAMFWENDGP
jgi:PAS domain-containing protein